MTLVVTSSAATTALTTVDAVKADLQITDTSQDEYLQRQIDQASALICAGLNVPEADDGTVTLGRETLIETIGPSPYGGALLTARKPIFSVINLTEGDDLTDPSNYAIGNGRIIRVENSLPLGYWWNASSAVTIEYVAGWLLPGDSGRNLPVEIEDEAIRLVMTARFNRQRDPALRSENILEGLYSYTLFEPSKSRDEVLAGIAARLQRYRHIFV